MRQCPRRLLDIACRRAATEREATSSERHRRLEAHREKTFGGALAALVAGGACGCRNLGRGGKDGAAQSTNPCESMIEIVRHAQGNVNRWRQGDMRSRWTAAGMLVAEERFRRIIGYRDLAKLVIAIERHAPEVAANTHDRQEVRELVTV
jgi:hypothetical protein